MKLRAVIKDAQVKHSERIANKKPKRPKLNLPRKNEVTAPRAGSDGYYVWSMVSTLINSTGTIPPVLIIKNLLSVADDADEMMTKNCASYYARFRKFHGLPKPYTMSQFLEEISKFGDAPEVVDKSMYADPYLPLIPKFNTETEVPQGIPEREFTGQTNIEITAQTDVVEEHKSLFED